MVNKLHQTASIYEPTQFAKDYQEPYDSKQSKAQETNFQPFNVEDEFKRKKLGAEIRQSYHIVKELVMTERTFKKDLDLLTAEFRRFMALKAINVSEFQLLDQLLFTQALLPMNEFHGKFLKDLELRLYQWSDKSSGKHDGKKVGDLLLNLTHVLQVAYFQMF